MHQVVQYMDQFGVSFSENQCANEPLSFYAATKSNEMMAHAFSNI